MINLLLAVIIVALLKVVEVLWSEPSARKPTTMREGYILLAYENIKWLAIFLFVYWLVS